MAAMAIFGLLMLTCQFSISQGFDMASEDKAVLYALRATIMNKTYFPKIDCGLSDKDVFTCDTEGHVTNMRLGTLSETGSMFGGNIPQEIGDFPRITNMSLSRLGFIGTIPTSICKLKTLIYLSLRGNQLSGSIPECLGQLPLIELRLFGNQLSGEIPSTFDQLKSIVYLKADNNQLSGSIPPSLSSLPSLQLMNISNNFLIGPVDLSNPSRTCVELENNCLFRTSCGNQRTREECVAFCNALQANGPCAGAGVCSNTTESSNYMCTCDPGYYYDVSGNACGDHQQPSPRSRNVGAIVGGTVGGLVAGFVIAILGCFLFSKKEVLPMSRSINELGGQTRPNDYK